MNNILTQAIIDSYSSKKIPKLIEILQKRVNKKVRLRDQYHGFFKCISCQKTKPVSQMNAGHFLNVGDHSAVRFNLDNIHGQCVDCNCRLNGNGKQYAPNLIRKIGKQRFDALMSVAKEPGFKWDRITLIYLLELFKDYK